ncbi:hypothetical protein K438DRAFT_1886683 [Mycena galopus ATCC 62051]|nr:hypothetical protein K438DRAFT_1886683 [Mycena galopus ATCC 62051]
MVVAVEALALMLWPGSGGAFAVAPLWASLEFPVALWLAALRRVLIVDGRSLQSLLAFCFECFSFYPISTLSFCFFVSLPRFGPTRVSALIVQCFRIFSSNSYTNKKC